MTMTHVWITGVKGFIGRHLAKKAAGNGAIVSGIDLSVFTDSERQEWRLTSCLNGEVSSPNLDRLALEAGIPDQIYHLAGGSSVGLSLQTPEEDFRRSVGSTMIVLEWARNHAKQARIVLTSSAAVYGDGHDHLICESDTLKPFSPYGYHKRMTELLCESYSRNYGLSTAVVRLFSVYGPELRKQLLWDLCNRYKHAPEKIVLGGNGNEKRDWLNVLDAVEFLLQASTHAHSEGFIVNGGTGLEVSVREVAECVRNAWVLQTEIQFNGASRPGDPSYLVADTSFGGSLNMSAKIGWREGMKQYVDWFRRTDGRVLA